MDRMNGPYWVHMPDDYYEAHIARVRKARMTALAVLVLALAVAVWASLCGWWLPASISWFAAGMATDSAMAMSMLERDWRKLWKPTPGGED
jgi:hypothetical protein